MIRYINKKISWINGYKGKIANGSQGSNVNEVCSNTHYRNKNPLYILNKTIIYTQGVNELSSRFYKRAQLFFFKISVCQSVNYKYKKIMTMTFKVKSFMETP